MCETGRDCTPVSIGALVVQMITSLICLLIYIHYHATYGVLSDFQHCGYILVYSITLLDILGGIFGILALKHCWSSNYFNYTPCMMCLLLAACFNCFVYLAFKSTLDVHEMKAYLREYINIYHKPPAILMDLQTAFRCCGIFNYTDYPAGKEQQSCCPDEATCSTYDYRNNGLCSSN